MDQDEYEDNIIDENPSEFIKKAAEERAFKAQMEYYEQQMAQRRAIQELVDRKIRENKKVSEEKNKIKTIEDLLKKGKKIKWEISTNNSFKGFVRNKLVFEIKKGLSIYSLYVKDKSFLKENSKLGYTSCSYNFESVKNKAEKLLII